MNNNVKTQYFVESLQGFRLEDVPQLHKVILAPPPPLSFHPLNDILGCVPASQRNLISPHVEYIWLEKLDHITVNPFKNVIQLLISRVELPAGRLDAKARPRLRVEASNHPCILPPFADMSRGVEFRQDANSPNPGVLYHQEDVFGGVDFLGGVRPESCEVGVGFGYEREALGVGYVPVEGVQFAGSHGVDGS